MKNTPLTTYIKHFISFIDQLSNKTQIQLTYYKYNTTIKLHFISELHFNNNFAFSTIFRRKERDYYFCSRKNIEN